MLVSMLVENEKLTISRTLGTTVEFLFAGIIAITFFSFFEQLVPLKFDFRAGMILIGFITVLADMIGYFRMIDARPYKNIHRFILDLILLYLFFQLLYSSDDSFEFFLLMYPIIFGFFMLYTAVEFREYKEDDNFKKLKNKALLRKLIFVLLFIGLYLFYIGTQTERITCCDYSEPTIIEIILLISVLAIVIGNKAYLWHKNEFITEKIIDKEEKKEPD